MHKIEVNEHFRLADQYDPERHDLYRVRRFVTDYDVQLLGQGHQIGDVIADLVDRPGFRVVKREYVMKVVEEYTMSSMGYE